MSITSVLLIVAIIAVVVIIVLKVKKPTSNKPTTEEVTKDVGKEKTDQVKPLVQEGLSDKKDYGQIDAPDLATTNSVVWMAYCINLPFLSQDQNMRINMEMLSLLKDFEIAVKAGDQKTTVEIYNKFQAKMKEKAGSYNIGIGVFKICALSKDLLDLYKMVIEGQRNEDVLSGKGSIRRILKYSIELGTPAKTLDALTDYFVNNAWFDNMPEQEEWHKLALECMMVTGNEEMGNKILGILQKEGGIDEDEKEELLNHARESRSQIDASWM